MYSKKNTGKIETGRTQRVGGRIHAVRPVCVRPQSRSLAIVCHVLRTVAKDRGAIHREVREIVRVGTDIFGPRIRSVLRRRGSFVDLFKIMGHS